MILFCSACILVSAYSSAPLSLNIFAFVGLDGSQLHARGMDCFTAAFAARGFGPTPFRRLDVFVTASALFWFGSRFGGATHHLHLRRALLPTPSRAFYLPTAPPHILTACCRTCSSRHMHLLPPAPCSATPHPGLSSALPHPHLYQQHTMPHLHLTIVPGSCLPATTTCLPGWMVLV